MGWKKVRYMDICSLCSNNVVNICLMKLVIMWILWKIWWDGSSIEGDHKSYDYIKSRFEINHLKFLYRTLYIHEEDNLFLSKQLSETYSLLNFIEFKSTGEAVDFFFRSIFKSIMDLKTTIWESIILLIFTISLHDNDNVHHQWADLLLKK